MCHHITESVCSVLMTSYSFMASSSSQFCPHVYTLPPLPWPFLLLVSHKAGCAMRFVLLFLLELKARSHPLPGSLHETTFVTCTQLLLFQDRWGRQLGLSDQKIGRRGKQQFAPIGRWAAILNWLFFSVCRALCNFSSTQVADCYSPLTQTLRLLPEIKVLISCSEFMWLGQYFPANQHNGSMRLTLLKPCCGVLGCLPQLVCSKDNAFLSHPLI